MTDKPTLSKVFAKNAAANDIRDPDIETPGKFEAGFFAERPTFRVFNFILKQFSQGLVHINERGMPDWSSDVPYIANALAFGSDGNIYRSLVGNNIGNDPTLSPNVWAKIKLSEISAPREYVLVSLGGRAAIGDSFSNGNSTNNDVQVWDSVSNSWGSSDNGVNPLARPGPDGSDGFVSPILGLAQRLQELTGTRIYVVTDFTTSGQISDYTSSGVSSTRYVEMRAKVASALASGSVPGRTKVDFVHIGLSDVNNTTRTFATMQSELQTLTVQLRGESWCDENTPLLISGPTDATFNNSESKQAAIYFTNTVDSSAVWVNDAGESNYFDIGYEKLYRATTKGVTLEELAPTLFRGQGTGPAKGSDGSVSTTFNTMYSVQSSTGGSVLTNNGGIGNLVWGSNNFNGGSYTFVTGFNNTHTAGDRNLLSGDGNTNTLGDNNIIGGTGNNNNGGNNLVSGAGQDIDGNSNLVGGFTNNVDTNDNMVSGRVNSVTDGNNNIVSGDSNGVGGPNNAVSGQSNVIDNSGAANTVGGLSNSISGSYNLANGVSQNIDGSSNVVGGGSNTVATNDNILGGVGHNIGGGVGGANAVGGTNNTVNSNLNAVFGTNQTVNNDGRNLLAGNDNNVNSNNNAAVGSNITINVGGGNNTAFGLLHDITGAANTVSGNNIDITGNDGIGFGRNSTLTANDAVSIGRDNSVTGNDSKAIGFASNISVAGSHTMGVGLRSNQTNDKTVLGKFNTDYPGTLFEVGAGTGDLDRYSSFIGHGSGAGEVNVGRTFTVPSESNGVNFAIFPGGANGQGILRIHVRDGTILKFVDLDLSL